jgi:hypothetical protein
VETLRALERTKWLNVTLGANGRRFYREHYDWPVVIRKYLDMIDRLRGAPANRDVEVLPSWRERRQLICRPALEILAAVPTGPSLDPEPRPPLPSAPPRPDHTGTAARPVPSEVRHERGSARARRHDPRPMRPRNGSRRGA